MLIINRLFSIFNLCWVLGNRSSDNVLLLLIGPSLQKGPKTLWYNAVKALLFEIWFERNQRVFHYKATPWLERFKIARLNASTWCTQSRSFVDFSIQDIVLNWRTSIFSSYQFFVLESPSQCLLFQVYFLSSFLGLLCRRWCMDTGQLVVPFIFSFDNVVRI